MILQDSEQKTKSDLSAGKFGLPFLEEHVVCIGKQAVFSPQKGEIVGDIRFLQGDFPQRVVLQIIMYGGFI